MWKTYPTTPGENQYQTRCVGIPFIVRKRPLARVPKMPIPIDNGIPCWGAGIAGVAKKKTDPTGKGTIPKKV